MDLGDDGSEEHEPLPPELEEEGNAEESESIEGNYVHLNDDFNMIPENI
jgi:hypothetical protein